jgi:hypothetical protein
MELRHTLGGMAGRARVRSLMASATAASSGLVLPFSATCGKVVRMSTLKQVAGRRPKKTYQGGRSCAHRGCTTVLSKYNRNEFCWQHYQPVPRPARIPGPPAS